LERLVFAERIFCDPGKRIPRSKAERFLGLK
jgi:hypothetical protein